MEETKPTFNCVRCGFETEDKSQGCPACGCGLLLPHEKWKTSQLGVLPPMPEGVARRLRGKDGDSPELNMVKRAQEPISNLPGQANAFADDFDSQEEFTDPVIESMHSDIPLPPVEYLFAEEQMTEPKDSAVEQAEAQA